MTTPIKGKLILVTLLGLIAIAISTVKWLHEFQAPSIDVDALHIGLLFFIRWDGWVPFLIFLASRTLKVELSQAGAILILLCLIHGTFKFFYLNVGRHASEYISALSTYMIIYIVATLVALAASVVFGRISSALDRR